MTAKEKKLTKKILNIIYKEHRDIDDACHILKIQEADAKRLLDEHFGCDIYA